MRNLTTPWQTKFTRKQTENHKILVQNWTLEQKSNIVTKLSQPWSVREPVNIHNADCYC